MTLSKDKKFLYIAERTGASIATVNTQTFTLTRRTPIHGEATGITTWGDHLLITCTPPSRQFGELLEMDATTGKILHRIKVGQGARAPVVDDKRKRAYVCNYFMNSVSVIDLTNHQEIKRIPVPRLPSSAILSADGKTLYVTNLIPDGPSNIPHTAAKISVINTITGKLTKNIKLPNGSNALRDTALSADGRFLYVTHSLARFLVPTTQLDRGWINTSGLTIIDTRSASIYATVLLDDISRGAPGSWGVDISTDQKSIYIAHSGTHELSIIDAPALMKKIASANNKKDLEYDLSIMSNIRHRIPLPGNGPQAITSFKQGVLVAQYYSDDLTYLDFSNGAATPHIQTLHMNPSMKISQEREGEIFFNDATHCFQQWLSCNACHPDEARVDGLNWDLLNDGIGNPKNAKSLLYTHFTPPTTITGCRANAYVSVRAGVRYSQFAEVAESKYEAVDAYLKSLKPEPSPYLIDGKLSPAAKRGERLFKSPSKGACRTCHNGTYLTDMKMHNMHNAGPADRTSTWDTPGLHEVWRTAPYLHDGRSSTIKDVLTTENHADAGKKLSPQEIDDLTEYVLSL
jgi:YVTN family beta-propeller protein